MFVILSEKIHDHLTPFFYKTRPQEISEAVRILKVKQKK